MTLYGVIVTGVYPPQVVTVSDSKARASGIVRYLRQVVSPEVEVQEVSDFYPPGMVHADQVWLDFAKQYRDDAP